MRKVPNIRPKNAVKPPPPPPLPRKHGGLIMRVTVEIPPDGMIEEGGVTVIKNITRILSTELVWQ